MTSALARIARSLRARWGLGVLPCPHMPASRPPRATAVPRLAMLAVFLATILVFSPALQAGWLNWDDDDNFLANPMWRGLSLEHLRWMWTASWMGHYQPLSWMSLGLEWPLWGLDARGYHATNVLLQASSAVLLLCLLADLLPEAGLWGWLAGALFFAVHPLRVESVAWVTERRDVLAMPLFLGALLAWVRYTRIGGRGWYVAAVGLHLLSLAAKAHAVTLPGVLLVLDAWPLARLRPLRRSLLEKLPFVASSLLFSWLALRAQHAAGALIGIDELSLGGRLEGALYSLSVYPGKILLPLGLSPLYPRAELDGVPVLLSGVAVGVLTLGCLALVRRAPGLLAAWLLYLGMLLPVSGLFQAGPQAVADRYTLFAGLPASGLVAWAVGALAGRRAALAGVGVALGGLGALAFQYTLAWRGPVSLWGRALLQDPSDPILMHQLADGYALAGQPDRAEPLFRAALIAGNRSETALAYGRLLFQTGRSGQALALLAAVPEEDSAGPEALCLRGQILHEQGDELQAADVLSRGLSAGCREAGAGARYADTLDALGRTEEAADVRALPPAPVAPQRR